MAKAVIAATKSAHKVARQGNKAFKLTAETII